MSAPDFRLCSAADHAEIVRFLDENWGSEHPLVHRAEYFDFYYRNGDALQFAFGSIGGEVIAIAGYIRANERGDEIWVSIWCAKKGYNGAGLELMSALPALAGAKHMACNNIRPKTTPFYTFLGYTAARLPHFYRLVRKEKYAVARVANLHILPVCGDAILTKISDETVLAACGIPVLTARPHKDLWYVSRRYFAYPHQKYDTYAVLVNGKAQALLVTRVVAVNGTYVLRIVDYIGPSSQFSALGRAIDVLMQNCAAEYADCYCYGISAETFAAAGFCEREENDENCIPNYLDPPLYENTEYYFFTDDAEDFTMFKADGDQDRPNL